MEVGKDEDPSMPAVSGPVRIYGPGRWLVRFRMRAEEAGPGTVAAIEAASAFGGTLARRDLSREEVSGGDAYSDCALELELDRIVPLSFHVRQFNRARLRVDRIEIEPAGASAG